MSKSKTTKRFHEERRAIRTRAKIVGKEYRPRLSVFRSNKNISAQIIDDNTGKTLVSVYSIKVDTKNKKPIEIASLVGSELAKNATKSGIKKVVFDRGAYKYHGRVKALADAAREGGLQF